MNERHLAEIEKTLLYISDARNRAADARKTLERDCAEQHLITAVVDAENALAAEHRRLMQSAFFAVPAEQERLTA